MPEKSNEELLDAALSDHEHAEWLADGNNNPKREGIDEAREAARKSRSAVLACMTGPGEVVVPKEFLLSLVGLAEHAQTYARNFGDFEILADANKAIVEYETLAVGNDDAGK